MRASSLGTVAVFIFSRLLINATRRFPYPFIPAIAQYLGVSVDSIQLVLALSWGVGLASPLFGTLSERYGRKAVMIAVMLMMAFVSLLGAAVPQLWAFGIVMVGYGIGKIIFDPTVQAYVGEHVPYAQRARVWGAIELSWSSALFISAPLVGFVLARASLGWVFLGLAALMLLSTLLLWHFTPPTPAADRNAPSVGLLALIRQLRQQPRVWPALGFMFLMITAQETFFMNYGLWMEASFGLVLTALGVATITLGLAEAGGELLVSLGGDRIGKHRLALYGALLAACGFVVIPLLNHSLGAALAGIFVVFVLLEASIVAAITLFTELMPEARAVMMGANISAMSFGRLGGALVGGMVLNMTGSFVLVGIITMLIVLAGAVCIWRLRGLH